jgi:hypothetical protein
MEFSSAFLFSSNESNGASSVSDDGSRFQVQFRNPIDIPKRAKKCTVELQSASIWNSSFNISEDINNNKVHLILNGTPHIITIVDGQYSNSALNSVIQRGLVSLGIQKDGLTLVGDDSTQKIILQFGIAGLQVDFTQPGSVMEVLGFNSRVVPNTAQSAGYYEYADNQANFNRVSSYLLVSSLVSVGLPINNSNNGILASIPIMSKAGSFSLYQPSNPILVDASNLIGMPMQVVDFTLLDQDSRAISTNGEYYNFTIIIRWTL